MAVSDVACSRLRILYDARSVRTPAGVYVFRGLTSAWRDSSSVADVHVAIPHGFDQTLIPAGVEPVPHQSSSWLHHVRTVLPRLADRLRADVIFSPNAAAPRDPRSVLYFQDLYHFRPRVARSDRLRGWIDRAARASWRAIAAPMSLLGVAVSTEILDEVRRHVRLASVLIPNGVDVDSRRWTGDGDYVLVMGGIGARKDSETAIRAWSMVPPAVRHGVRLCVVGVEPAARRIILEALASSLDLKDGVMILGETPRDEFLQLIERSRLAISCSRLEAFGLPVAEALALGAPLLCSDIPSHRELLRRASAGREFITGNPDDLGRHIECVLRGALPPTMTAEPATWTWRARAREHLDAYREAAARA